MSLVEEAIRSWEAVRAGVMAELENIPEESWGYRPAPESRSVAEVARHVAEYGVGFVEQLVLPGGLFVRLNDPAYQAQLAARLPAAAGRAALLQLLRATGDDGFRRLRAVGEPLAEQRMKTAGGDQSRLTGLHFAIGHESYHRGQIVLLARGVGLVPVLTQQLARARYSTSA